MILAATGHRPNKLGGYSIEVDARLRNLARVVIETVSPIECVSGMALGWDMAFAEAAIELNVPLCAAVPFIEQPSQWPESSQRRYFEIISRAARVVTVCPPGYSAKKMQLRNEWMVDECGMLVALWDGTTGGTFNCVKYANRKKRLVCNVWEAYSAPTPSATGAIV